MKAFLIVFLGAGLGGVLRHGVNVASLRLLGGGFPYGTLAVNVAGSFAMGVLAGYLAFRPGLGQAARLFVATGVLGGFTTFSTFSLDTVVLYERGAHGLAAVYLVGSVALAVGGLFVGLWVAR